MVYILEVHIIITEIWKDIKEYEGLYQVSNLGQIRSLVQIKIDIKRIFMVLIIRITETINYQIFIKIILRLQKKNYPDQQNKMVVQKK